MTRLNNIVKANLNDLVDQCEDPEKMLRQAVRDMETALGHMLDGAARAIAHHKLVVRQEREQRDAALRCATAAKAAVDRGDDASARAELARKAEHVHLADALAAQSESADKLSQKLRRQVATMRLKLAEARRKLTEVTARTRASAAQRTIIAHLPQATGAVGAASHFAAICERVEQTEAETEALLELLGDEDTTATTDAEIEAELRSLKEAARHVAH
jgi:phage shock protein A